MVKSTKIICPVCKQEIFMKRDGGRLYLECQCTNINWGRQTDLTYNPASFIWPFKMRVNYDAREAAEMMEFAAIVGPPAQRRYTNKCWKCRAEIDSLKCAKSNVPNMGYHCPRCRSDLLDRKVHYGQISPHAARRMRVKNYR